MPHLVRSSARVSDNERQSGANSRKSVGLRPDVERHAQNQALELVLLVVDLRGELADSQLERRRGRRNVDQLLRSRAVRAEADARRGVRKRACSPPGGGCRPYLDVAA
jgi:hypothetical protein